MFFWPSPYRQVHTILEKFSGYSVSGKFCLAALVLIFLASCQQATQPKPWESPQNAPSPEAVHWNYMPKGLALNIEALSFLNYSEGFAYNLMLCTYQLSAPAAFQELAATPGGIHKLLQCERFDPAVVQVERHFIQPGEKRTLLLDRAEGARHVGLVAGYNQPEPGLVTRLYTFPLTSHRRHGWWPWSSRVYNPGTLSLDLLLDDRSLQLMGVEK